MKKKCAGCKKEKKTSKNIKESDFYKSRDCKDGFDYICKECHNERASKRKKEKRKENDDFYNSFL